MDFVKYFLKFRIHAFLSFPLLSLFLVARFHVIEGASMTVFRPRAACKWHLNRDKKCWRDSRPSSSSFLPSFPPLPLYKLMSMAGRFSLSFFPFLLPLLIPEIMVIARRNDRAVRSLVARNRRPSAMVRQPANVQGSTNLTIPRDHPAKHRFPLADCAILFSPFASRPSIFPLLFSFSFE